jgi:O-antigen/teichoic acid export membrane protein
VNAVARLKEYGSSALAGNVVARIGALVALAAGTFAVAKAGGPEAVGVYALLRVLPGLVGVVISAGLPGAIAYFLAGPSRSDRRLPATIVAITLIGGVAGTLLWALGSMTFGSHLFPDLSLALTIWAGGTVLTQLIVATAKSCSQGSDDMRGANLVIFNEEFMFLPAYGVLWGVGIRGYVGLIAGLMLADILTFVLAWARLAKREFFHEAARPSIALGRDVTMYGLRAQVGGVVSLLNLRFDFIVLNLLAGPAVLGVYSIASKFAELLKIPALALTYVLYPQFAREGPAKAAATARRLIPRAAILTACGAIPLLLTAGLVIPLYGHKFHSGIVPARIIVLGLAIEGAAGVMTAFMYGIGRPGLNSLAMAAGLVVTVGLDLALIPHYGATGAAVASAVAYVTSTVALGWYFVRLNGTKGQAETPDPSPVHRRPSNSSFEGSANGAAEETSFVAFAPTPDGYQLVECVGAPVIGGIVDMPNHAPRLVITKLGRSPLPLDQRPCAYLEPWTSDDVTPRRDGGR